MTHTRVTIQTSPLLAEVWEFYYLEREHRLALTKWQRLTRQTTRHKLQVRQPDHEYNAYERRGWSTQAARPEIPADVAAEALRLFTERIKVGHFSD
jgi:hypothetical protein